MRQSIHFLWSVFFSFALLISCGTKKQVRPPFIPQKPILGTTPYEKEEALTSFQINAKKNLPPREMRGVWLTSIYGLDWPKTPANSIQNQEKQKRELVALIDRLYKENYNTVFLQVRHRGDVIYRSTIEPIARVMTGGKSVYPSYEYDPLQIAVEECHKRGMACHAWIVTFPLGNDKQVQTLGSKGIWGKHRNWCIKFDNEWYLNPGLPQARNYIASLARELVASYDIDGIHLDYIRYPDNSNRFPDADTYKRYGKKFNNIADWRRDNITKLLECVYDETHEAWPFIQVSAATLGKYRVLPQYPNIGWTCFESVAQDPKAWFLAGAVDFIVPMMYYRNEHFDPFLENWHQEIAPLGHVVPGIGAYRLEDGSNWNVMDIKRQIEHIRKKGFSGICFYREENIRPSKKTNSLHSYLRSSFSTPSVNIPFPSSYNSPPLTPRLLQIISTPQKKLLLSWEMPLQQTDEATYNLYYRVYTQEGEERFSLLATGINQCHYEVDLYLLPSNKLVEFCVEAVNRHNVAGPVSTAQLYFVQSVEANSLN
ncbi:MAG: family 10 glycosylhydrolase [Porphyromonas sp.]|nr:family 10 glycosylhydrolase [Porphyromonas sp.]